MKQPSPPKSPHYDRRKDLRPVVAIVRKSFGKLPMRTAAKCCGYPCPAMRGLPAVTLLQLTGHHHSHETPRINVMGGTHGLCPPFGNLSVTQKPLLAVASLLSERCHRLRNFGLHGTQRPKGGLTSIKVFSHHLASLLPGQQGPRSGNGLSEPT